MGETWDEWRVTGDPGHGYPAYDFTWSNRCREDAEAAARRFVESFTGPGQEWADGPYLSHRTCAVTDWEPVELATDSRSAA